MKLVVTIDTEEDDWGTYHQTENTCQNIEKLVPLQELFARYNVIPTYLINYPVATNERSLAILEKVRTIAPCEIGMHCHPWNTPPFSHRQQDLPKDTFTEYLPEDEITAKLETLFNTIRTNTGITPVSFRGGRFSFGPKTASALVMLGITVDTSVTAFYNWHDFCGGNDYSAMYPDPYRFAPEAPFTRSVDGALLEVPVTGGYLQPWYAPANAIQVLFTSKIMQKLHLLGILDRMGLVSRRELVPEVWPSGDLVALVKSMLRRNSSVVNMIFHSTALTAGYNPFVKTKNDDKEFLRRITTVILFANANGIESVALKDFAASVPPVTSETNDRYN